MIDYVQSTFSAGDAVTRANQVITANAPDWKPIQIVKETRPNGNVPNSVIHAITILFKKNNS